MQLDTSDSSKSTTSSNHQNFLVLRQVKAEGLVDDVMPSGTCDVQVLRHTTSVKSQKEPSQEPSAFTRYKYYFPPRVRPVSGHVTCHVTWSQGYFLVHTPTTKSAYVLLLPPGQYFM
jgi:hypothetical protein